MTAPAARAAGVARRSATTPPAAPGSRAPVPAVVVRARVAAVCAALVLVAFLQTPGKISRDTKLDLYVDPVGLMRRGLSLWDPSADFGRLGNQAYGYLFPMGPFFALTHALRMPVWMAQRAWLAALLVLAFLGVYLLAGAMRAGTPLSRGLAAVAYATAPMLATVVGPISSEALPIVAAPWVLLPLVRAASGASPRRAAAASGVAVLACGGVNAVATLAVLPLPALYLLTRARGPRRRALAGWWVLAGTLACAWWVVPLVMLGRYSFPFLDYIESAAVTSARGGALDVLRGGSHWLAGLVSEGSPWWRGGWVIASQPLVVLDSLLLAAFGLVGVAHRGQPERRFLLLGVLSGVLLTGLGYAGAGAPPWAVAEQVLLDGVLAPFRNVHKFDLVLRLPLALGVAHAVPLLARALVRLRLPRAHAGAPGVAALLVVGTATPFLVGAIVPAGAYTSIPGYWQQAASWLAARSAGDRTLVVPAAGFAEYYWGSPMDEPLQALAGAPWAVRDQIPLGSEGSTRLMDAVQARLGDGQGSPGLATALARAGVRFLLVRNDLTWARVGAPEPVLVHQAIERSGGLTRVAAFGPGVGATAFAAGQVGGYGTDPLYQAVEVYRVDPPAATVRTYPAAGALVSGGGVESVLQLADAGLLGDRYLALDGDPGAPAGATPVVSDGQRRREVTFGTVYDNATQTLTATEPYTARRPAYDQLPRRDAPLSAAVWTGVAQVSASTSAAQPDAFVVRGARYGPQAAVDGDPGSAWMSSSSGGPVGQWLQVRLDRLTSIPGITVSVLDSAFYGGRVSALDVTTDAGTVHVRVADPSRPVYAALPPAPTRSVRVTIAAVAAGTSPYGVVGLREVTLAGVTIGRTLVAPPVATGTGPALVTLGRALDARGSCVHTATLAACDPSLARAGEEAGTFDRTVDVPAGETAGVTGTARPVAGPALDQTLAALAGGSVAVSVSSQLAPEAASGVAALLDGDPATAWVAAPLDPDPSITLSWAEPRTVDRIRLDPGTAAASRPEVVDILTPDGERAALPDPDGTLTFAPVTTTRIVLRFPHTSALLTVGPRDGSVGFVPVGVAGIEVPALADLMPRLDAARPYATACGASPGLLVDGTALPVRAAGTVGDLLAGRPLTLTGCAEVTLTPGTHRIVEDTAAGSARPLAVQTLSLAPPAAAATAAGTADRAVSVTAWGPTARSVRVAPGAAAYLVLAQNANPGWRATVAGAPLAAARMDGWQQAYELPASAVPLTVTLAYTPAVPFLAGLAAGAVLAIALLALALVPARRCRAYPALVASRARVLPALVAALLVVAWGGPVAAVTLAVTAVAVAFAARRAAGAGRPLGAAPAALGVVVGLLAVAAVGAALAVAGRWAGLATGTAPAQRLGVVALGVAAGLLVADALTGADAASGAGDAVSPPVDAVASPAGPDLVRTSRT